MHVHCIDNATIVLALTKLPLVAELTVVLASHFISQRPYQKLKLEFEKMRISHQLIHSDSLQTCNIYGISTPIQCFLYNQCL